MRSGDTLLALCGVINLLIALLHVAVIYYGAPAYRFFGAGEQMAVMSEQGSLVPAMVTSGVTLVFFVFALVTFAQAGWLRLPFSFQGVFAIATIYTLRGLLVVPLLFMGDKASQFDLVSSLISLLIGAAHFAGLYSSR
jgi:hypothetical protein